MNSIRRRTGTARAQNPAHDGRGRAGLTIWAVGRFAVTALATLSAANASYAEDDAVERVHEITWIHASPAQVHSFVVFVSPEPASLPATRQINVGKPGGTDAESPQFFSALVPVGIEDFVAVAAIGQTGLRSVLSEWGRPQPSRPGQPLLVEP